MEVGQIVTKSIVEDVHEFIKNTPSLKTDEEKEAFKTIINQSNGLEALSESMTPLFRSVQLGRIDHIEVLIEMKADFIRQCQYKSIDEFIAENEENCVKICKVIREAVKKRGADGVRETIVLGKIKTLYEKNKKYDPEEVLSTVSRQIDCLARMSLNTIFDKSKEANKDYVLFTCRDPVTDEIMEYPGKFDKCRHWACFDIKSFLIRNKGELKQQRPFLKCPVPNCQFKTTKVSNLQLCSYVQNVMTELKKPEKIHFFKSGKYVDPCRTKPDHAAREEPMDQEPNNTFSEEELSFPAPSSEAETSTAETPAPGIAPVITVKADPDAVMPVPLATSTQQPVDPHVPALPKKRKMSKDIVHLDTDEEMLTSEPQAQETAQNNQILEEANADQVLVLSNGTADNLSIDKENYAPCAKDLEIQKLKEVVRDLQDSNSLKTKELNKVQDELNKIRTSELAMRKKFMESQRDNSKKRKELKTRERELEAKVEKLEEELNKRSAEDDDEVKAELAIANAKLKRFEAEREQLGSLLKESTMVMQLVGVKEEPAAPAEIDDSEDEYIAPANTSVIEID